MSVRQREPEQESAPLPQGEGGVRRGSTFGKVILSAAPILLLVALSAVVLLPVSPVYRSVPGVDPSVYLYVGRKILHGGMPYLDAWDHKQPVLYLLYAFAQWITPGGSLWGMWLLLWAGIASTGAMTYLLLERAYGRFLGFLSVSAGLLALYPVLWGGAAEEFSLPFQAAAVILLVRVLHASSRAARVKYSLALGVCISLAFFLKQNLVAAGAAAGIYLVGDFLLHRRWRTWTIFPLVFAGFLIIALPIAFYISRGGAAYSYQRAAFLFNTRYAGLGLLERFSATLDALEFMSGMPGLLAALGAWIACGLIVFLQVAPGLARFLRPAFVKWAGLGLGVGAVALSLAGEMVGEAGLGLVQRALIGIGVGLALFSLLLFFPRARERLFDWLDRPGLPESETGQKTAGINLPVYAFLYFPVVMGLMVLSGRNYVYYFIPFIPFLMIAFAGVAGALVRGAAAAGRLPWALVLAAWLALAYLPLLQLGSALGGQRFQPLPEIVDYVRANTNEDETILVWGKPSTYVYHSTQRFAPSQYFYQAPVFEAEYNEDYRVSATILRDIELEPPRLFLYDHDPAQPVPGGACPLPATRVVNSPGQIFTYICEHYTYEGQVSEFLVFRLRD